MDSLAAARKYSDLVGEALGYSPVEVNVTPLTLGNSGVSVVRLHGKTASGGEFSVVVKARANSQPHAALWYVEDKDALDREYLVYGILERLALPHPRILARRYGGPSDWTLVLEDLAERYRLPETGCMFSQSNRNSVIDTYALIHSKTMGIALRETCPLHEEGSEVTADVAKEMLGTLGAFEIDGARLKPDEFDYALSILLECRTRWADEPRCLVYGDFHHTNVALPRNEGGHAVLFDWELARAGLPQFDALNAGFADEAGLARYAETMQANGVKIDLARFRAGLKYAELSAVFYTLWLLHTKLKKDSHGRLPNWMRRLAKELFEGGLAARARDCGECGGPHQQQRQWRTQN